MVRGVEEGPLILVDPHPRTLRMICDDRTMARLARLGRVVEVPGHVAGSDEVVRAHLPEAAAIIGQTSLDAERIAAARNLRAVINVEGNFLGNVDYGACRTRGIHVLSASPAFAGAVAEAALGMAIDLARGIGAADRAMRAGTESYGLEGNRGSFLLAGSQVGIVGFGDLGRALRRLLVPFGCDVLVHDPWLPDLAIEREDASPAELDELLAGTRVVFVFAAATDDNQGFLGERALRLLPEGAVLLIMSRAAVVDFDALVQVVREGRIRVAVDVFPEEPLRADHPIRRLDGMLLSPHRAGAMGEALQEIGRLAVGDLELILRGLPPQLCKRAEPELVGRLRSKPVEAT